MFSSAYVSSLETLKAPGTSIGNIVLPTDFGVYSNISSAKLERSNEKAEFQNIVNARKDLRTVLLTNCGIKPISKEMQELIVVLVSQLSCENTFMSLPHRPSLI